jgi:hypothetical protein
MFFSKLFKKREQPAAKATLPNLPALNAWNIFFQQKHFTLYSRFAGALPGESADCIYLKSYPELPQLERVLFGEWLFSAFNGIFLQRWDAAGGAATSLLFIDAENLTVKVVKTNIAAKNWSAYLQGSTEVAFTFTAATKEVVTITVLDIK